MILEMNKVQDMKWCMKQTKLTSEISCTTDSCLAQLVKTQMFYAKKIMLFLHIQRQCGSILVTKIFQRKQCLQFPQAR